MTKNYPESIFTFMQMYGLIQEGIHYTWCIQSMQMFNSDYINICTNVNYQKYTIKFTNSRKYTWYPDVYMIVITLKYKNIYIYLFQQESWCS